MRTPDNKQGDAHKGTGSTGKMLQHAVRLAKDERKQVYVTVYSDAYASQLCQRVLDMLPTGADVTKNATHNSILFPWSGRIKFVAHTDRLAMDEARNAAIRGDAVMLADHFRPERADAPRKRGLRSKARGKP